MIDYSEKKWLETAIPLDWGLTLYEDYAKHIVNIIYTMLFDKENKKRRKVLIKIMANLRLAYDLDVPLRYSRHKDSYKNARKNFDVGSRIIFEVMDVLLKEDIIAQRMKGFIHYNPNGDVSKNRQTRIWSTPNLIGIFEPIQPEDVVKEPPQLIQLKERLTKEKKRRGREPKQLKYPLTEEVLLMERQLQLYHNLLEQNNITLEIPAGTKLTEKSKDKLENVILKKQLYSVWRKFYRTGSSSNRMEYRDSGKRIQVDGDRGMGIQLYTKTGDICVRLCYHWTIRSFTTTFDLGGRYYNIAWGQLSSELRKHLKINFESVVEPDFQGLHPNMIYHLNNMNFEGDVYACGDAPRKLYKIAFLVLINSRPTNDPYKTVAGVFREKKLYKEFPDCLKKKILQPIIDDIFNTHNRISKYFFSDIGLKLQNLDSQITSNILNYFIEKGIPILPVHDSYIIQQQYKDELINVMTIEYQKIMKFKPVID